MVRLTSLLRVEERLLEADHFARRLARQSDSTRFGYELNAFLSASRSVTFLMQKELSKVEGFAIWWESQRAVLAQDSAANFFLELRNFSQKQGRVSVIGSGGLRRGARSRWSWRFAGTMDPVPESLLHREVSDCCREHVAKLATIALRFVDVFPRNACPTLALTPEGVKALGLSPDDIDEMLGLPRGWSDVDTFSPEDRIKILRGQVDRVDLAALRRLAAWRPRRTAKADGASARLGERLQMVLVDRLEHRRTDASGTVPVLESFLEIVNHDGRP